MHLVISTSLNINSRSRVLAKRIFDYLQSTSPESVYIDLRGMELPMCDAGPCYGHPQVGPLSQQITEATGIVLAAPVYNYDVAASAKNLIELTGRAWTEKVVGFVCAAGGDGSYMSLMGLANSLMLDFRSFIIPRFVYATGAAFNDQNELADPDVEQREQKAEPNDNDPIDGPRLEWLELGPQALLGERGLRPAPSRCVNGVAR